MQVESQRPQDTNQILVFAFECILSLKDVTKDASCMLAYSQQQLEAFSASREAWQMKLGHMSKSNETHQTLRA